MSLTAIRMDGLMTNDDKRDGRRKTWIETTSGKCDCRSLFDAAEGEIDYPTFRTRLKSREQRGMPITPTVISDAARLD